MSATSITEEKLNAIHLLARNIGQIMHTRFIPLAGTLQKI